MAKEKQETENLEYELKTVNTNQEKYFDLECKSLDEKTREFSFYASTEKVDRHGDIVLKSAFNLKNIQSLPIHYLHGEPVGKTIWAKYDKYGLFCGARIDKNYPEADKAFEQVKQGSLAFTSIGFCGGEYYRDEKQAPNKIWCSIDLGEISLVSVPSNTGAIIKSFDMNKIQKAFENETDIEYKSIYENILQNKYMLDDWKVVQNELAEMKIKNESFETKFNQLNEMFEQLLMKDKKKELELQKSIKSELHNLQKLLKK